MLHIRCLKKHNTLRNKLLKAKLRKGNKRIKFVKGVKSQIEIIFITFQENVQICKNCNEQIAFSFTNEILFCLNPDLRKRSVKRACCSITICRAHNYVILSMDPLSLVRLTEHVSNNRVAILLQLTANKRTRLVVLSR